MFTATAPGTYTIQATIGSTNLTTTVNVSGAATAIKGSTVASMVANGKSTQTVNLSVIDANGNVVTNYNGNVTVTISATNGGKLNDGLTPANTETVAVTNGVGKYTILSPASVSAVGQYDTITVSDASGNNLQGLSTKVNYVAQVATATVLTPATASVSCNSQTGDTVTVQVVDQSGVPMLAGTYTVGLTVSGPAKFADGTTGPTNVVYTGNGTNTNTATTISVNSQQGQAGTITVNATSTGLTSGSASITAALTQAASKLSVVSSVTSVSSDVAYLDKSGGATPFGKLTLTATDANGNATNYTGTVNVTIKDANGNTSTAIVPASSTVSFANQSAATLNLFGNATQNLNVAGTYTITLTDAAGVLSSSSVTITETAGAVAPTSTQINGANGSSSVSVSQASPNATLSAQLYDAQGNKVSTAGVPVVFTLHHGSVASTSTATINGIQATSAADGVATVSTNASGVASVSFAGSQITGDTWTVSVTKVNGTAPTSPSTYFAGPVTVNLSSNPVSTISLALTDTSAGTYNGSITTAVSSNSVSLTPTFKDQYGNALTGGSAPTSDTFKATISNYDAFTNYAGSGVHVFTKNADGTGTMTDTLSNINTALASITAKQAGTVTVTLVDMSVGTQPSGSTSISVIPDTASGASLFNSAGKAIGSTNLQTVAANTPVQITLMPVDTNSNPTVFTTTNSAIYLNPESVTRFLVTLREKPNLGICGI